MAASTKSWRQKREDLYSMINKLSAHYGGDDPTWLDQYIQDIINRYAQELDTPISCFTALCRGVGIKVA